MKKVILISGGSDGLGKALAQRMSKEHTVIVFSQDKEKLSKVATDISCEYEVGDVSSPADVKKIVSNVISKHGRIDCLVNNAGIWIQGLVEENDPDYIKKVIEVNTSGTIILTGKVVSHMKKQKSGRIINVISQAGLYPKAERSVYTASKWAITGFTQSLQLELEKSNIAVTGFYPGPMKTDFFKKAGIEKDTKNYMNIDESVRALEFIINTNEDISIPELGIRKTA